MISGPQIREGRNVVGWSLTRLARYAKVEPSTVERAEAVDREPPITFAQAAKIQSALEAAGCIFTAEKGGVAGVQLRKRSDEA